MTQKRFKKTLEARHNFQTFSAKDPDISLPLKRQRVWLIRTSEVDLLILNVVGRYLRRLRTSSACVLVLAYVDFHASC